MAAESVVLKGLHHPSIIQHIDTFEVPGKFCIVAEFAEAGDLETVMKKKYPSGFPENAILDYFIQVGKGPRKQMSDVMQSNVGPVSKNTRCKGGV